METNQSFTATVVVFLDLEQSKVKFAFGGQQSLLSQLRIENLRKILMIKATAKQLYHHPLYQTWVMVKDVLAVQCSF